MQSTIDKILDFWFGPLSDDGLAAPKAHRLWFSGSKSTDDECTEQFGSLLEKAACGELDSWTERNDGLMALVLLLDQMPRNVYRGTPAAFSGDSHALQLALQTIARDRHLTMPLIHRVFLYLPLEHSEDLALQQQCVSLFDQLAAETGLKQMADFRQYAVAHRDVIAQFGRFPHRNAILGRQSTPAELHYLVTNKGF